MQDHIPNVTKVFGESWVTQLRRTELSTCRQVCQSRIRCPCHCLGGKLQSAQNEGSHCTFYRQGAKAERERESRISSKALYASHSKKGMVKCYHCGKLGHLGKISCLISNDDGEIKKSSQHKASVRQHSKGECDALVIEHVLQAGVMGNWIIDSGGTCHMCMMKSCSLNNNCWRRKRT